MYFCRCCAYVEHGCGVENKERRSPLGRLMRGYDPIKFAMSSKEAFAYTATARASCFSGASGFVEWFWWYLEGDERDARVCTFLQTSALAWNLPSPLCLLPCSTYSTDSHKMLQAQHIGDIGRRECTKTSHPPRYFLASNGTEQTKQTLKHETESL
jgi:hypothetical protein